MKTIYRILFVSILLFIALNIYSIDRPKLVVGIVIDQMRWDYLYRYQHRYSPDGFRRLMNEGYSFDNNKINYVPSFTAVGHTSIYTGSVPNIHGITANTMIFRNSGEVLSATADTNAYAVGIVNKYDVRVSPHNILCTTITDELKMATNFRAKVIGVSLKDRGSIFPAGRIADGAFWLDEGSGNWITSSWYMETLPKWIETYNSQCINAKYLYQSWELLYPADSYTQSVKDYHIYEAGIYDDKDTFPIDYYKLFKTDKCDYGLLKESPFGNTLTKDMAKLLIENYNLGSDDVTDFIAVSFSSSDYIGHRYSPHSIKVEDCYLRLDIDMADLLSFLDKKVGKGNYLLFLTADHGASYNAQFMADNKIDAGVVDINAMRKDLNDFLFSVFSKKNIVKSLYNYQVHFDYSQIGGNSELRKIIRSSIQFLKKHKAVAYAIDCKKVSQATIPFVIKQKIINGYHYDRSGDIQIILKPHYYSDSSTKGTTHGSWNAYDTHIPLLFFGKGVPHGKSTEEVYITDIAPTISMMLGIPLPSGTIGKPLIFK